MSEGIETQLQKVWISTKDVACIGWETMVFLSDGKRVTDWSGEDCVRYRSESEAIAGHGRIVDEWRKRETA